MIDCTKCQGDGWVDNDECQECLGDGEISPYKHFYDGEELEGFYN